MSVADTNALLYAADTSSPGHRQVSIGSRWLEAEQQAVAPDLANHRAAPTRLSDA